jgi:hypothetical protein
VLHTRIAAAVARAMNILTQIALLSGLIACISLLWLVGRAFGKHPGWGFAVLLLWPLAAVVFGIRYWRDEKGPFLVHLATLAVAVLLGLYEFTARGVWDELRNALGDPQPVTLRSTGRAFGMAFVPTTLRIGAKPSVQTREGVSTGTRPAQAQAGRQDKIVPATNSDGPAETEPGTPKVSSAKPIEPKANYRAAYVPIDPSMAGRYVGMTVKVKRLNRPEQDCVLRRVSSNTLAFEQHSRGGTFSFEYRRSDIEKLRVLVKQTY